jgi:hypothetical protein
MTYARKTLVSLNDTPCYQRDLTLRETRVVMARHTGHPPISERTAQ